MGIEGKIDVISRDERRPIGPQDAAAPVSDDQTDGGAGEGEQSAFGEELAQETAAARAERGAHGHLFLAPRGLRQKKIGEIRAGDQQNQADGSEHHRAGERELVVIVHVNRSPPTSGGVR